MFRTEIPKGTRRLADNDTKPKRVYLDFIHNLKICVDTNLITMAFVHAALEAVHAHDTSGVYCTVPAKIK